MYENQKKYMKEKTETLTLRLRPGEKDEWKKQAELRGMSLTQYVRKLIQEDKNKSE